MISILEQLLEETSKHHLDVQMKVICDQIMKEEHPEGMENYKGPVGPNVFISIPLGILTRNTEHYLCLERESRGVYVISHWNRTSKPDHFNKKVKVWESKYDDTKKILKEFVDKATFLKGE